MRRIGVLTGGGDCPGLNAVIRAVVKKAIFEHGLEVVGIRDGFLGLVENNLAPLSIDDVSGILTRGGTILGTNNRCNPTRFASGHDADGQTVFINVMDRCLETLENHGIEALIVIGGDGTMTCAAPFAEAGINCIGVPKTIDNDIFGTEVTFGFRTAVSTATDALDRLHTTAESHHRVILCELMGRNAGWLPLYAGVASGADVILLPEIPFDIEVICNFLRKRTDRGRNYAIVACAEGAHPQDGDVVVGRMVDGSHAPVRLGGIAAQVAQAIEERIGVITRTTVLGHIQRGGSPVASDRVLATGFGCYAVDLLMSGAEARVVVMQGGQMTDIPLLDVADKQRLVPADHPVMRAARALDTCFGDRRS